MVWFGILMHAIPSHMHFHAAFRPIRLQTCIVQRSLPLPLHSHGNSSIASRYHQAKLEEPEDNSLVSTLSALLSIGITSHVEISVDSPSSSHRRACKWKFETGNEERSKHGDLVFDEIGMGTLNTVEDVGLFIGS